MYWPRLKLTNEEKAAGIKKYDDVAGRSPLPRMYPGHLVLDITQRNPSFSFQVSRRSRVCSITFAGDVDRFRLEIITSTGEKHTADPILIQNLLGGWCQSPLGLDPGVQTNPLLAQPYPNAYTIEPNIVLMPNQTLTFNGYPFEPFFGFNFRVDFTLHVVEFPGMWGSPTH